jgi:pantoate--beta-alanine ligase
MRSFLEINPLRSYLSTIKSQGHSIGFVPTMGALHKGHEELINRSIEENQCTVVSIFVNKAQFNNADDFAKYPDKWEQDIKILESLKCDIVFAPSDSIMYPYDSSIGFNFGALETVMEGNHRPGHFSGVGLVVSKFFNIISPDRAYFGQKDLQQGAIIQKLTRDLDFPIDIRIIPTVRDQNGLALSSRNLLLTDKERVIASEIHNSLVRAKEMLRNGGESIQVTKHFIEQWFSSHEILNLEYFEIVSSQTLRPIDTVELGHQVSLCVAAYIREVRLIDNIYLFD